MDCWNLRDGPMELGPGEIHVWHADLDRHQAALPELEQTLAPGELARAAGLRHEADRRRYVFAHGVLRSILARYLDTRPGDARFLRGPHGKPELAGGAVRFNLSHSYDVVLCAVSRAEHVGVDVERLRSGVDQDLLRYLPARARQLLEALPRGVRRLMLFQGWTRLEAYAKARGEGIDSGLATFDLFVGPRNTLLVRTGDDDPERRGRWWVQDLVPRRGYVGAVAAPRARCSLKCWRWTPQETCSHGSVGARVPQPVRAQLLSR